MATKFLDLVQGSPEWHEYRNRQDILNASDAPAMMGESPYKTRAQLMAEFKGHREEVSPAKQALFNKGHAAEAAAREVLALQFLDDFAPAIALNEINGLNISASLDGLSEEKTVIFEHKLWNEELANHVRNKDLPEFYKWQLDHQLAATDTAQKVLFVVSDGTADKREMMYYERDTFRINKLLDGWAFFAKQLPEYEKPAPKVSVIAEAAALPAVTYSVVGTEITTNIRGCLDAVKHLAAAEMAKTLESDQDFADKDQLNKDVKKAREALKQAVSDVRQQFISFADFEAVATELDGVLQKMQSHGEKLVKEAKEAIKSRIIDAAKTTYANHLAELTAMHGFNVAPFVGHITGNWLDAIKGKRTVDSISAAIDAELARISIDADAVCRMVAANLNHFKQFDQYRFLFPDLNSLAGQDWEFFNAVVEQRINAHKASIEQAKAEEQARIEAEQARAAEKQANAAAIQDQAEPAAFLQRAPINEPTAKQIVKSVTVFTRGSEALEEFDHNQRLVITEEYDGVITTLLDVHDGEREDNFLHRNFSDCYKIGDLLEAFYEAGKRGDVITFKHEETNSI